MAIALAVLDSNVPGDTTHGTGKPVMEVPGATPTFPVIVEAPVQVTVLPARTE